MLASLTNSASQKHLQITIIGLSIFSCQGPGYFLPRQKYVKARTFYSYYLVFLTDPLAQSVAEICGSMSYTPLHPQGHSQKT